MKSFRIVPLNGLKWVWITPAVLVLALSAFFYHQEVPSVLAQSAADSLPGIAAATAGQKVLVFSPHPDDETIAAGGYIAASRRSGAEVRIVLVTNGNWHALGNIRHVEFENATHILGVPDSDLVLLNLPDARLAQEDEPTLRAALATQIEQYHPDIVVYPDRRDANPDHYTVGRLLDDILDASTVPITRYSYLVHFEIVFPRPRKYDPDLYLLPPRHLLTSDRKWQRFAIPLSDEDAKTAAIFCYRSQLNNPWLKGILLSSVRRNELFSLPVAHPH